MHKRMTMSFILAIALSVVTIGVTGSAHAGIIVTVGKPLPEDATKKSKPGANLPTGERTTASGTPCPTDAVPDKSDKGTCTSSQKIDPLTGLPSDWKCVPIGNGQLYCEAPSGTGGGAGAGGAGAWDGEDEAFGDEGWDESDEELQVMGCGGGATGGMFAMVLAALAVLGLARRRVAT